jgi:hypothetical protein
LLRRQSIATQAASQALAAIGRGEGDGGAPLVDLSGYFYLPGRPGGQVARGATEAAGTLTLSSTMDVTKGKIIFGTAANFVYDEVNGRLGIGLG